MNLSYRKATLADCDFIVDGIIESEKSGSNKLPYSSIFGISEQETRALITQIFEEEIEGQEWCLEHFWIAEADGQPAGCLSAWIEGVPASGQLKAQAMAYFLDNRWQQASDYLRLLSEMQLSRLGSYAQLECIYTHKAFRGYGIAGKLIAFVMEQIKNSGTPFQGFEIQLLGNNAAALRSYTKCGFLKRQESTCTDNRILDLLADGTRISMVLQNNNG